MNDEEFKVKGPDAEGTGFPTDHGFLVKAGSLARRDVTPSASKSLGIVAVHRYSSGLIAVGGLA